MVDLLNPGTSGWCAILPKRKAKATLQHHIDVDLLVIGGGFAGLAAATRRAGSGGERLDQASD